MEVFGARPFEATSACLEEISNSDALIGIYAHRYGYVPNGQSRSITQQEFDFAMEKKKPTFCFVVDEEYPWPPKHVDMEPGRTRRREFLQQVREKVVIDTFTSPEDLAFKVASSLGRFLLFRKVKDELEKIPAHESVSVSTEHGRSQVARRAARIETVIRGARLLLVNDIPTQMSHVIEILRDLGVDVQVETSSDGALRALSNHTYEVVISAGPGIAPAQKKHDRGWGCRGMRYPASEKLEIIRLVEQSHLPVRRTLEKLGVSRVTFYRWYDLYQTGGPEALEDRSPRPERVWNRIPNDVRGQVVQLALDEPELSPRELATRFTDTKNYFVSEASVYRLLKEHDLIASPGSVGNFV